MRIFGCGLPKTGITSLKQALTSLRINTTQYAADYRTIAQLKAGDFNLDILQKHDAVIDLPVTTFYEEMDSQFVGSKFILTTREKSTWLESNRLWSSRKRYFLYPNDEFCLVGMFGCVEFNEQRYSRIYDLWYSRVQEHFQFRKNDLLELPLELSSEAKWRLLCNFLGKEIPNFEYPWENKTEGD